MIGVTLTSCFFDRCMTPLCKVIDEGRALSSSNPLKPSWGGAAKAELAIRGIYALAIVPELITSTLDVALTTIYGIAALVFSVGQSDRFYCSFYRKRIAVEINFRITGDLILSLSSLRSVYLIVFRENAKSWKSINSFSEIQRLERTFVESKHKNYNMAFKGLLEEKRMKGLTHVPSSRLGSVPGFLYSIITRVVDVVLGILGGLLFIFTLSLYKNLHHDGYIDPSHATQIFSSPILLFFDLIARICQLMKPKWTPIKLTPH